MTTRLSPHILDAKKLFGELLRVRNEAAGRDPEDIRAQTLLVMQAAYDQGRQAIRADFLKDGDASKAIREATAMIDLLIATLFQFAGNYLYRKKKADLKKRLTIIAVGGYGRAELFPYSDIDVLFLHDTKEWEQASKIAEFILYILWDMGMQVGQSVRTVEETISWAHSDMTVLTNLLDKRLVCGNAKLMEELYTRYWSEVATEKNALAFVEAKLNERDERHQRAGDSRYVLEPKLKEGKGGMRDLQTLHWLARYVYRIKKTKDLVKLGVLSPSEYRAYIRASDFLNTVRIHMHLLAERPEERLTFDMQRSVAERMGYRDRGDTKAVERFMKAWFLTAKTIGNLTRVVCAVLEDERKHKRRLPFVTLLFNPWKLNGFTTDNGRLAIPDDNFFKVQPSRLIELFMLSQKHDLDIHPRTLRQVTRSLSLINTALRANDEANGWFMEILTSPKQPEITLRRMNEAGVLGKFVPDFGRVVGQMQFDMYHIYTVDEHTIFALGLLNQIRCGERNDEFPLASRLIDRVTSLRVLFMAVLCHDIAKGRGGDHSILGEKIARKLSKRMGLDAEEAETVAWLVRYHLFFSRTAFKRDVTEDKTIIDFIAKVQSPERLRLLLILTVVDIRAVGPQVWNSWKGALLRELYFRAEEKMGAANDGATQAIRNDMLSPAFAEGLPTWSLEERAAYLSLGNEQYFKGFDIPTHIRVAKMLKTAEEAVPLHFAINITPDPKLSITEILLTAADRKGLFALMAGVLTSVGANIVNAKIFTLKNGMAVEQFYVQDFQGNAFENAERMVELEHTLRRVLASDGLDVPPAPAAKFGSQHPAFTIHPRVIIENTVSSHHTVIETNGQDRPGFLYTVTRALTELDLGISTAHVSSYGERAVDVFYVKDKFGMKITSEPKLRQVREKLLGVLQAPKAQVIKNKQNQKTKHQATKGVHYA
ncbi:MAG: [protein-PII] uridylyltransferase [Alphaproteobacteria bacterium]|nr:[protein-PII] uridylyltransferase [Alphaproteobacteria bacterium]